VSLGRVKSLHFHGIPGLERGFNLKVRLWGSGLDCDLIIVKSDIENGSVFQEADV
jgi:hypothetical protein